VAEHRPFPPSPRREALARRAGVVAASPWLTAAAAWLGALVAAVATARAASGLIGAWIARAADEAAAGAGAPGVGSTNHAPDAISDAGAAFAHAAPTVLELALPILVAAAIAAVIAHLAQTRAVWLPRRRIAGAPAVPGDAGARARRAGLDVVAALAFGATAFGWLWLVAPRVAKLPQLAGADDLAAAGALIASSVATLAIAWVVAGAIDALARTAERAAALRMTTTDKRDDDRLAAADPRWRERRRALARRAEPATEMPGASLLVLGDGVAAAVAWDAVRRPVPARVVAGAGARVTQLVALARRHRVPVHRDPTLARALARGDDGPVDRELWPRLAEVIAAVRR
jgi:flagellar biosynthetic protein FlhB